MFSPRKATTQNRESHRVGVCVLELIIVVPIVMMFLLAVVTFGLILSESTQVLQAANIGAQQASVQARSSASSLLPQVVTAVDSQFAAAGFSVSDSNRQVIVESSTIDSSIASAGPGLYSPADAMAIPADSVRVTVAVRLGVMSEDFMATYGFSIANGYAFYRVVKKYNGPSI